jgi:hypothetical protein
LYKENKELRMEKEILKKAREDSSETSNIYTQILICMRRFDERYEANIYQEIRKYCIRFMRASGAGSSYICRVIVAKPGSA